MLSLAPDPASARAGYALAVGSRWAQAGRHEQLLWGYCQGSGKVPYQTVVDLAGPAFRCSCPSRKFPCKHAIGLMLLAAAGQLPAAEPPGFASSWLESRREKSGDISPSKAPPDAEAAARRAAQRGERVRDGLAELDRWLSDQVRTGLAGTDRLGYAHFDRVAARMVDAQAPAVSGVLRNLASIPAGGPGWPGRLLEEYALLRLLAGAHERLDDLRPELADTVRARVGYPVSKESVLAGPPVHDRWLVVAVRDSAESRINTRRVWLVGRRTRRRALVLSFAPSGQPLDSSLTLNTVVDADLHFYPGSLPLRALVGSVASDDDSLDAPDEPAATDIAGMLSEYAEVLGRDPWSTGWPVLVRAVPLSMGGRWLLSDGQWTIPMVESEADRWRLLAVSGGHPVTVMGEWCPRGLLPLTVWFRDRLVAL